MWKINIWNYKDEYVQSEHLRSNVDGTRKLTALKWSTTIAKEFLCVYLNRGKQKKNKINNSFTICLRRTDIFSTIIFVGKWFMRLVQSPETVSIIKILSSIYGKEHSWFLCVVVWFGLFWLRYRSSTLNKCCLRILHSLLLSSSSPTILYWSQ